MNEDEETEILVYPDGRRVTFLEEGTDEEGAYLRIEHCVKNQGTMNGPHWHPHLSEAFSIQEGRMRFLVGREQRICEAGETITIHPGQVHQFWNISEEQLRVIHEIRPPGQHRQMFETVHYLEWAGKMTKRGIPRSPLWLGLLWELIDGYIVGPPRWFQICFFGGLAQVAKRVGYGKTGVKYR